MASDGRISFTIEINSEGEPVISKITGSVQKFVDTASQGTEKAAGGYSGLWKEIAKGVGINLGAAAAVSTLKNQVVSCFTEAMEAELVDRRLNAALRENKESVQVMGPLYDEFAGNMQAATGYTDEEVKSLAALAYHLGINQEQMQDVVKGAIGLTTIYGGSLQGNLEAVARAYQGNWRQAQMLIPEIMKLENESDKLALLQEKMGQGFRASQESMGGAAGALKTARNQWADFKETVGTGLLSLFSGLKTVSDEMTGQAYLARKLRAEYAAYDEAIEKLKRTRLSYADVTASDAQDLERENNILEEVKKTREAVDEEMRKATEFLKEETIKAQEEYNQHLEQLKNMLPQVNAGIMARHDTQVELDHAIGLGIESQGEYNNIQYDFQGIVADSGEETKKWTLDWKDANEVIEFGKNLMGEIAAGLEALGVKLGDNGKAWLGVAQGAATFTQGLIQGNPLTVISGAVTMLTNVIKALAGDGIGEAIKRENEWMALNKEHTEQLRELADEVGTVHEATSIMLDEIIEQSDVTVDNFDEFAQRIQQILSNLDRGEMSLAETTREIGDAFDALILKARDLGTEGSASIMTLIDDLKNRGIEVKAINEYIEAQLQAGYEGYKQMRGALSLEGVNQEYLDQLAEVQRLQIEAKKTRGPGGMVSVEMTPELEAALKRLEELRGKISDIKDLQKIFGDLNVKVFADMERYEKKVAANKELEDAIDGATRALIGLSNAQKLTEVEFDSFGKTAASAYEKLIGKGYTGDEAMRSMKAMLQRLQMLKEQFGFSLDPELQKLLDTAIKKGIVVENAKDEIDYYKDMVGYQEKMTKALGEDIPKLLKEINEGILDIAPIPAASGLHTWVRGGSNTLIRAGESEDELVNIMPLSQLRNGWAAPRAGFDSPTMVTKKVYLNIEIHSPTLTPEQAASAFRTAYIRNTRQMRTLIKEGK